MRRFFFSALYSLLALVLGFWLLQYDYFIGHDGVYYARVAESIFSGRGIEINPGEPYLHHPPFYPFLIGLANLLLRNLELAVHSVSLIAFALTIVPLFLLAAETYSEKTAHWASLLYLTNPHLLSYSGLALTDPLFTLFVMTELCLIHRLVLDNRRGNGLGLALGAVTGMAYLTRPEGIFFHLTGLTALFLLSRGKTVASRDLASLGHLPGAWNPGQVLLRLPRASPGHPPLWKFRIGLLSTALFLLFFFPYVLWVHQKTNQWQLSGGVPSNIIKRQIDFASPGRYLEMKKIYEGLTEDKTRLKMEELTEDFKLLDYVTRDRFLLIRSGLASFKVRFRELSDILFDGLGFFLMGAALFVKPWDRSRKKAELLHFLFLLPFLGYLFVVFDPRRYFVVLPIFILWMAQGIETIKNWAKESFRLSARGGLGVTLLLGLVFILPGFQHIERTVRRSQSFEARELGLWMKQNIPEIESEAVAARHPAVNFYSGSRIVKLPYVEKLEDLFAYLGQKKARYFVVSEEMDEPFRQSFQSLLDESKPLHPRFHRKHAVGEKNRIILYEVRK